MERFRTYNPRDEAPAVFTDRAWRGVNMRLHPTLLPEGMAAEAINMRFRNGAPETRGGLRKINWANRRDTLGGIEVKPWGSLCGVGTFDDPDEIRWDLVASGLFVYRLRENNHPEQIPLPQHTIVFYPVNFVQAFGYCVMFRGVRLTPLVMTSVGEGFKTITSYLSQNNFRYGTVYNANDEIAWPPVLGAAFDAAAVYDAGDQILWTDGYHYTANATTLAGESPTSAAAKWDRITWSMTTAYVAGDVVEQYSSLFRCLVDNTNKSPFENATEWEPVEHRIYKANTTTTAGDTPQSAAAKWDYELDVIPNADNGLYLQNRLFIPHGDEIAASDIQDLSVYVPALNDFRINQGASDKLIAITKFNDNTIIAFKERSVYAVENVYGELADIRLNEVLRGQGLVGAKAFAHVGKDLWFLSQRGVISLVQTEQNKLQGVELPVSDPIQPLINRIDWTLASKAVAAYWDNKFYLSVPFIGQKRAERESLFPETPDLWDTGAPIQVAVEKGKTYYVDIDEATTYFVNGTDTGIQGEEIIGETYYSSGIIVAKYNNLSFVGTAGQPIDRNITDVYEYHLGNQQPNAVLVYDFLNGAWCGHDEGEEIRVVQWHQMPFRGRERLWALTAYGALALYEDGPHDQLLDNLQRTWLVPWPIATTFVTRAYGSGETIRWNGTEIHLATWNPTFSVQALFPGVEETKALLTDETRSRTRYIKPFNRAAYSGNNINGDHAAPYREDYSVDLATPTYLDSCVNFDRFQDQIYRSRIPAKIDSAMQLKITNTLGRIRILDVKLEAQAGPRRKGNFV